MNVLGMNFGHDAGISLVVDGVFVKHWEKERHRRLRHALGLRARDIEDALACFGMRLDHVDRVAITTTQMVPLLLYDGIRIAFPGNERFLFPTRGFYDLWRGRPDTFYHHLLRDLDAPEDQISVEEFLFPRIARDHESFLDMVSLVGVVPPKRHTCECLFSFKGPDIPGAFVSHHFAHAYYVHAESGRRPALIISFDGICEPQSWAGGGLYAADPGGVSPVEPHGFHFGPFYTALGDLMGLGPVGSAGKLMGLAAWGEPNYYEPRMVGTYCEARAYFDGATDFDTIVRRWLAKMEVAPDDLDLRACAVPPAVAADIAASAQAMFTDSVIAVVAASRRIADALKLPYELIGMAGGCALNCPANTAVHARFGEPLFIPPAINDEGISAGAALCYASLFQREPKARAAVSPADIAFKGPSYTVSSRSFEGFPGIERVAAEDAATFLAHAIAEGAVVAIFDGKAEIGPRALGHRSLIASPLLADNWQRMNAIKGREPWRPFAPVALADDAHKYFDGCPPDSYYMLFNARVTTRALPAVTHRDGSARLQIALPETGFIHQLLVAFKTMTGFGVLLNTSFNGRGEPIVETPHEAILSFLAMKIDYLYLQGYVFRRSGRATS
jgi:carbamoyltransferase